MQKIRPSLIDSKSCFQEAKNCFHGFKKGKIHQGMQRQLLTQQEKAIERAKVLPSMANPSSTVYIFVELLETLKED